MNCPHCQMPQRRDYLLEFQCGTQRQVGHVTRSNRCYENEIAQLKGKVKRLEEAGDALFNIAGKIGHGLFVAETKDAWTKAKATQ